MITELQQWILTGFAIYIVFMFLVVFLSLIRHRGKIKVRIKTPLMEIVKWVKPERDGKTLVIDKGKEKKGIPRWEATFTNKSLVPMKGRFRKQTAVDIFVGAKKCIEYDYSINESLPYGLTIRDILDFLTAKILKQRGSGIKQPTSVLAYVTIGLLIIVLIEGFLILNRIGSI